MEEGGSNWNAQGFCSHPSIGPPTIAMNDSEGTKQQNQQVLGVIWKGEEYPETKANGNKSMEGQDSSLGGHFL